MLARLLIRTAFSLIAALLVPAAVAQGGTDVPAADARVWLERIHQAASQRNYRGTLVFSAAGNVSSSRIAHYCEGPHQYERIEALDGQMRRVFRHDDAVLTLWPESRIAVLEQRDPRVPFPSLLREGKEGVADHYDLRLTGQDRIAGHEAQVMLLQPRDAHRFGQRLWAEKGSGLLLRADILSPKGDVLESASFSELALNVRPQLDSVLGPMRKLEGWQVLRRVHARARLEEQGWSLSSPVAGFREISCIKRALQLVGKEQDDAGEVLQTIFSDGLTHVSVFIEPFNAERHHRPMHASVGATHTLMRRHGEWWITVVGDVPVATLKMFATALERRR
jgi:sigma-E factor negative regulatory protein RseB